MKRAGTNNEQFRKRVPTALLPVLRGTKLSIDLPKTTARDSASYTVSVTISDMITFSLGVPASRLAAVRHAIALRHVEAVLEAAQRGPEDLSHMQIMALQGEMHKELLDQHEANPPARYKVVVEDDGVEEWEELSVWREMIADAESSILLQTPQGRAAALVHVKRIIDLDAFISSRALMLSDKSYRNLVEGMPETLRRVVETLSQRSHGNYTADPRTSQYPQWKAKASASKLSTDGHVKTFDELFERWKAADKRAASTISTWRGYMARFKLFVGHDDPHRVERGDAQRWKDSLIEEGLKKISTTYLATFNTLYRFGMSNSETTGVTHNPFDGVKAQQKAAAGTKRIPFTRGDVALILNEARGEKLAHLRWIPWLQAQTGARVAEIAQLWGSMIVNDDNGHPCLHITVAPDGGSLKNEGSERTVPLHPDLIADGFLDFVKARGRGPLFYGGSKGKAAVRLRDDQKHPSKGVSNRVGTWVRNLGIEDPRKAPTHAFRRWFKIELQRRSGCSDRLVDAIQGQAPRTQADGYYSAEPADMLAAIAKLDLKALADSIVR